VLADGPGGIELRLAPGVSLDFEAGAQPVVTVALASGGLAADLFTPTVTDVAEGGPLEVVFTTLTPYSTQNRPQDGGAGASVSADGKTITLAGNLWQRAALGAEYEITQDTRLVVEFRSVGPVPEIIGVGVDSDENPFDTATGRFFELGGSQGPLGQSFVNLRGSASLETLEDGFIRATIDMSSRAGQAISSLIFLSDDDNIANGLGASEFRNVVLLEQDAGAGSAPVIVGGGVSDRAVDERSPVEIDLAFFDADGDPLRYEFTVTDAEGADVTATFGLALSGPALTGQLSPETAPGVYTVTVTAFDRPEGDPETQSKTDVFQLTVLDVNDAPIATDPSFEPLFGELGQEIAPIDIDLFTGAFSDPDGDPLTYTVEGLPAGLSLNRLLKNTGLDAVLRT
jgi:hypothetical protein